MLPAYLDHHLGAQASLLWLLFIACSLDHVDHWFPLDNLLSGTSGDDTILGLGGNDILNGQGATTASTAVTAAM